MSLRVIQAFGGHSVGDEITDAAEIAAVLGSDQASFVVAVAPTPAVSAARAVSSKE